MKSWIRFWSIALAVAILAPAARAVSPSTVFGVQMTLQARSETEDSHSNTVLVSTSIKNNILVNLAMGRDRNATVPANQVLAAVISCGEGLTKLIVFDTNTSSNLATIASADSAPDAIGAKNKGEFVGLWTVQNVGNGANGITGGFLAGAGKATLDVTECITKASATLIGVVDVTITDDVGTHSFTGLIPKGKVTVLTPSIGTLAGP